MQLLPLTREQIHLGLRAMKAVAVANGSFTDEERTLLAAVAQTLGVEANAEALEPASPQSVAAAILDPDARLHVVQMLVFTAMIDGDATADELIVIREFAQVLDVDDHFIADVTRLASLHLNTVRLDMVRRAPFPRRLIAEDGAEESWKGIWRIFRLASQTNEDIELAWRCKRYGLLPEGTLGRTYWAHMTTRGFHFPGERGAILPGTPYHDFLHVLCGYDTDAVGETEMTAFTAGLQKSEDPFALLFGTLCMYCLGLRLQPGSVTEKPAFDAERVGRAFRRGLLASGELSDGWDYWADVRRPVVELQKHYNIYTI